MDNNTYCQELQQEISAYLNSHSRKKLFKKGEKLGNLVGDLQVTVDFGQIITEQTNGVSFSGSAIISFVVPVDDDPLNNCSVESFCRFSGTAQIENLHVSKLNEPITIIY